MFKKITSRNFSTLLIAESRNGQLNPNTYNALASAAALNKDIDILALGDSLSAESFSSISVPSLKTVYLCNSPEFARPLADSYSHAVSTFMSGRSTPYTHVIAASSAFSKDYFPRVSGAFGQQAITDIIEVVGEDTFKRPVYAGNAIATVRSSAPTKFLTIRPTNFEAVVGSSGIGLVQEIEADTILTGLNPDTKMKFVSEKLSVNERPDLAEAKIVVSGGRGLKNGENFKILEDLADALGEAAIGASRAAVDAGYCSNDMQIG